MNYENYIKLLVDINNVGISISKIPQYQWTQSQKNLLEIIQVLIDNHKNAN